ncbi:hypothetical protein ACLB2K_047314 [Fragaria x ananassa]
MRSPRFRGLATAHLSDFISNQFHFNSIFDVVEYFLMFKIGAPSSILLPSIVHFHMNTSSAELKFLSRKNHQFQVEILLTKNNLSLVAKRVPFLS